MAFWRGLAGVLLLAGCAGLGAQQEVGRTRAEVIGDGRADDGAALERECRAGREVWLGDGKRVLVGHSVRLGCDLHFAQEAQMVVPGGVSVELMGPVEAGSTLR